MNPRVVVITGSITRRDLDGLDRDASLIVLQDRALESASTFLEAAVRRRSVWIAFLSDPVRISGFATALFLDFIAVHDSCRLDWTTAETHSGALEAALAYRIGRRAVPLLVVKQRPMEASALHAARLCDAVVASTLTSVEWVRAWLQDRSVLALESGAKLIRLRSSDALERAEFSRLFAAGEPQRGLKDFLQKRRDRFSDEITVETI
ncbi:MAG TPA: hypothetical protein VNM92_01170 [Thermoanaerobaculia bacterium]|nr:hypothetical protein [Thermoanaerobaculia bacterium]